MRPTARSAALPVGPTHAGQVRLKLVGLVGKVLIDLIGRSLRIESHASAVVRPLLDSRKFIFAFLAFADSIDQLYFFGLGRRHFGESFQ